MMRERRRDHTTFQPEDKIECYSEEEWDLFASPANAARLLEALAAAQRGTTPAMTVEELRAAVGL